MTRARLTPARRLVAIGLLALLTACGGGGGGDSATPTPPSPLMVPIPPAASGDTTVQASYQPGVRELSTASGSPQLLQSDAAGTLRFSAAPGAQVGQVLIVAGRAYLVTAVDASGTQLGTRAPELGEVFSTLRIQASVQDASALPASTPAGMARPLASATGSTSFSAELGSLGPVGVSYKGQLAMKLNLDLDFTAASGFKTFDLTGDLSYTQTLLLQLLATAADGSTSKGLELTRFRYVFPQTLGLVQVEVPVVLQAQASGDAKLEMRVIDGETRAHVALHYDPATRQLQSSSRIDASAGSQAPTGTPAAATSTASLGLQLKVGPDLQLKILETVAPLSASLRANLGVSAQLVATGLRNCLGWKSELGLEASASLKLGANGDAQVAAATAPWPLGSGGDLEACQTPPVTDPNPTPTPSPTPTPAPVDGLSLLPLPAGAELLSGYRLALVPDTGLPLSAAAVRQQFNWSDDCATGGIYDVTDPAYHSGSPPVEMARYCVKTLEPQLLGPDGRRIDVSTATGQDWLLRFGSDLAAQQVRCAAELLDPLTNLFGDGGLHYTRRRGEMVASPLLSRTPPSNGLSGSVYAWAPAQHGNQFSLVCQMEMTERSSGLRYYLRSPLWVSPAGRVIETGYFGVIWNWQGN